MAEQKPSIERRKHTRFAATAFLNRPIFLTPLPPFFGHPIKGRLIDLSAGGLAVLIRELIAPASFLDLTITLPDQTKIESAVKIVRVIPRGRDFLHGIEFLSLHPDMAARIERISVDFIDCENRIRDRASDICKTECAFFTMCSKKEKLPSVIDVNAALELAFHMLDAPPTIISS